MEPSKELEILQSIIARQEEIRMKSRNWYITIVTALIVAFLSKDVQLTKERYLVISIILSILFFWIELIHRVAEQRAIQRSGIIEANLRNRIPYDGPKINQTLKRGNYFKDQIKEAGSVRLYSTYVVAIILIITMYFSKN